MDLGDEEEQGPRPRRLGRRAGHGDGLAVAAGGALRDVTTHLAVAGRLGPALTDPVTGYGAVYHIEILLLFAALIALGPLVRGPGRSGRRSPSGLPEFPS
jgi:BCD family chlorophyll transporter-like MFS transporter